jgi:hypothetical protein
VRSGADAHRICEFRFPGDAGRARLTAMDEVIARLPGLEWFNLGTPDCFVPSAKDSGSIGSYPADQALAAL